jgi:hypothetical protein
MARMRLGLRLGGKEEWLKLTLSVEKMSDAG